MPRPKIARSGVDIEPPSPHGSAAFVAFLREGNLLDKELTVDGTKMRASNSKMKSFTPELTAKELAWVNTCLAPCARASSFFSVPLLASLSDSTIFRRFLK